MVVRRSLRLAAALVLCCALAQAEDEEVNCKGMRVKALNNFLRARGLACEGCAEKADYVKLCEEHKDTPVLPPKEEPAAAAAPEKEKDVDDILKNLKGMPGMEGIKMFSGDDLKNMNYEQMGNMFGGGKPKRKTRSQYRRELMDFYGRYLSDDVLAEKMEGVDAALDKWKGREEKMFSALHKKYDAEIREYWDKQRDHGDAATYDEELAAGAEADAAEEDAAKAFGRGAKDEV